MKGNGHIEREIEALGTLVDRFGADRTRWPAPDRLRFATLLKESAKARRLLAEAEAFDRLLDQAPTVPAPRHAALVDRIVKTALAEGRDAKPAQPLAGKREASPATASAAVADLALARVNRRSMPLPMPRFGASSPWPAAALLAASLVIGLFAGSSGLLPSANFGFATAASEADDYGRALALGPDLGTAGDEDTL